MNLETYFHKRDEGERRLGTALTDIALDQRLEQFVRETAQNSADEAQDGLTPELLYRFDQLEGSRLDEFLDAINWDTKFRDHLEAVAENDDEIGVQNMVDRIERGTLPLLMVEDKNTTGLTGDEFSDDTNYASLIQDFGRSTKDESEGGVHGVGASVLWGFSGIKTAMFLTTPEGWADTDVPRFVGRIDLPFHEYGGKEWHGDGWIGNSDTQGRRAVSIEGPAAADIAADALHIDESRARADATGTTAIVVGFREPSRSRRSPQKVIERIEDLAVVYYWPLILEDGLEISVQAPDDISPSAIDPTTNKDLEAFIEAYQQRDSASETLDAAPDVAAINIPLTVPAHKDGGSSTDAEVTLVVRSHESRPDSMPNQIALFRGARHVVKYRKYDHIARSATQHFQAIILAGKARHPFGSVDDDIPDSDLVVEDFFRKAEPKAHDTWEKEVSKLEHNYPGGSSEIDTLFKDTLPAHLTELLTAAGSDDSEMLGDVGRRFPYFSGGPNRGRNRGGGGGGSRTIDRVRSDLNHIDDKYRSTGTLELTEAFEGDWGLTVEFAVLDSSNNVIETVALDNISGADPETGANLSVENHGTLVRVPGGKDTIEFDAVSVSTANLDAVGEGRARLNFTVETDIGGSNT
ncbi:hypothetical protein C457_11236 [Haloferax prahovense DSM 18310]|uniref:Uncharacterized protein n=1 Tax=Haloferax prahovense (strain DSM 18310 / JCM 13924 / TL6) TaxID=1227461 RepID=M0GCP5_HALPT|nr:hypothetical protein [Haloferax prahovense]ELZ68574.1 hypothetical protein C457_11236 [Haloferax prahovense DSM 18310]